MQVSETTGASDNWATWTKDAVIRSETDMQYQFRSLSLPESRTHLTRILLAIGGTRHFYEAARMLVAYFTLDDPLIIGAGFIYDLHRIWTNRPLDRISGDPERNIAGLSFRAYFDYSSCQLTQELSCVTASITAMELLLSILSPSESVIFTRNEITPSLLLPGTVEPLRDASAPRLTRAAIKDLYLHLKVSSLTK